MKYLFSFMCCLIACVVLATAHSTPYPELSAVDCTKPAIVLSYHVHIIFMLTDAGQLNRTIALREAARGEFQSMLGSDCTGRYDNGHLCFIYDHPIDKVLPSGPFPVGEWSMFVPTAYYGRVVPWFVQHRGEFTLLVHPNTGCGKFFYPHIQKTRQPRVYIHT
jgi:aromatic ring-cleaving dioxygenase